MKTKLKTLKDFENEPPATRQILLNKIKAEAIKWVKAHRVYINNDKYKDRWVYAKGTEKWIIKFFNLTEEGI